MTKEEGISQVYGGGGHVVVLGAGASIASTLRDPERNGKILPSMNNFIQVVGLEDIVKSLPNHLRLETNFESLYSSLHSDDPNSVILIEIESRIQEYFTGMHLSDRPTIYDYLMLALRGKDLIATFNWDPFLYMAFVRNSVFTKDLPRLSFLHGNVAIGYSKEDGRAGAAGMRSKATDSYYPPTKLLYPITKKNYNDDEFISKEWERVQYFLSKEYKAVRATIFGFGAPDTDVEAVTLLKEAWGGKGQRTTEQFEIIDVQEPEYLYNKWNEFIHSGHYHVIDDYFKSSLALNPRRTSESFFSHYTPLMPSEMFREDNPVPHNFKTLADLWAWHTPLIQAEQTSATLKTKENE